MSNIRNFVIIAHIDHGKSTLADRMLEVTETVPPHKMKAQYLDQLELERERGITIKMAPVRMLYKHPARIDADKNADERGLLYEDLTYKIRGLIFDVYNKLGPSYKENVYGNALEEELKKGGFLYEREKVINVIYDNKKVGVYKPDFVIDGKIILEIKAQPFMGKLEIKQTWYYLKGSYYRLALLVNFGSKELQIKRIVYDIIRDNPRSNPRESAKVEQYALNLIDTPGHSDFSYEVSRSLKAVEGAILLVDATQGIQAQTLANFENARKAGLEIIGAVNKIDVASSLQVESSIKELSELLQRSASEIFKVSGKTGEGVKELLNVVVEKVKAGERLDYAAALVFSSLYDEHKGVIAFVRVFGGEFKQGENVKLLGTGESFKIKEVGFFKPELQQEEKLSAGEIGYIATGIKDSDAVKVGDTVGPLSGGKSLPGFQMATPVVFVSLYPDEGDDYENLKTGLYKLRLHDSSFSIFPTVSDALGRGFQCGFLGRLHFEIVTQRLEREFNVKVVNSFPSVAYKVKTSHEKWETIENPKDFPDSYEKAMEPIVKVVILSPLNYLGSILKLKEAFRLSEIRTESTGSRAVVSATMPLSDLISDFDDKLKSVSSGFASFSYEFLDYRQAKVKRLDVLVTGEVVPGLSRVVPEEELESVARKTVGRLKELLPREQFVQAIQAAVHGRIIARETIPALKKDVTGYLYGGDRTRKMKLWKKQKRGKERLKDMGRVTISPQVFKELLRR